MKNRRHGRNHRHIITLILRRRTDSPVLLGLIVGVIGDILLAVFYIYGTIVWGIFILDKYNNLGSFNRTYCLSFQVVKQLFAQSRKAGI